MTHPCTDLFLKSGFSLFPFSPQCHDRISLLYKSIVLSSEILNRLRKISKCLPRCTRGDERKSFYGKKILQKSSGQTVCKISILFHVMNRYVCIQLLIALSNFCFQLMKIAKTILGEKLFTVLMKSTFYGHFVAGEDEVQITPVLDRLRQFGVKPILDYSVEEDISQEEAERREIQ